MLLRDWLLLLDSPVKVVNEEVSAACEMATFKPDVLMLKTSQMGPLEIAFSMNYSGIL